MALGIDDALSAAAAAISLTDTLVKTVKSYRQADDTPDLSRLIEEVRLTALDGLNDADLALTRFERTLVGRDINLGLRLKDVIAQTPFWKPWEQHRMKQIQKRFNAFSDSVYSASNDVAALLRCRGTTQSMGEAVIESAQAKHRLQERLLTSNSIQESIDLLRSRIVEYQAALS